MRVQALVPKRSVKRLDVPIVGRLAWPREADLYPILISPQVQNLTGKLAPIIAEQPLRPATFLLDPLQNLNHVFPS